MQRKLKFKNKFLVLVLLACLFMLILEPSRVWGVVLTVLGGMYLIGLAWAASLTVSLSIERATRFGWAQVGDHLEERFILTNQGEVPALWIEIVDGSDLPGHEVSRATGIDARSQMEWHTHSVCTQRGIFTLGPTLLRSADPFGFFQVEIRDSAQQTVMVMPPVVSLPGIKVAVGGRAGDGRPRHNAPDRTVSASSVREFVPGDSLRWVHWPTSARRDKFYVRLFDGTPAGDWRILVDLNQQVQAGSGWDSTEEHAVILAASLADEGLRQRHPVGLTINGSPFTWLQAQAEESQRWTILRGLALARPGTIPLAEILNRLSHNLSSHSSLVIITADTGGAWLTPLLSLLWRGITPTILLLDATTFASPNDPINQEGLPSDAERLAVELGRSGIQHVIIHKDLLDRPEARPGHSGEWEWKVSGVGRAVAVRKPSDLSWRRLG